MFVQVIEGKTSNPEGLRAQFDKWVAELQPGAKGYVGTTAGVAADGRVVAFARFESEDAARANSDRPEQGAWWAETEKLLDGPVEFSESSDVDDVPRRWVGRRRLRAVHEGRRRRPGEGGGG